MSEYPTYDYTTEPITSIRRHDRAVDDDAWIKAFLHTAPIGALATVYDGQPFINTNLFLYEEESNAIFMHTADVGRTRANIEANPKVCFSVMDMGRLLPAPTALNFSVEYAGVSIFGSAEIIDDDTEATRILQALLDKYAPHLTAGEDYRPPVEDELRRTTVYKITIDSWSGKKKEVSPDFKGAFWYGAESVLTSVRERSSE